mgnify:CR=1 FL=1
MAKLAARLKYWQGQAMSAETDEARDAADATVTTIEVEVAGLLIQQAAAQKEADRLEEANKNSQALSRLADEIASAKNETDLVVDGLVETQDAIYARMEARDENLGAMYEILDKLWYEAETETDESLVDNRWAAKDQAEAAIEQAYSDNDDDSRLIAEYQDNIRYVRNAFRITKAKLVAERTNAELMVAIKSEMNLGADLAEIDARTTQLQASLDAEADATVQATLQAQIDDLAAKVVAKTDRSAEWATKIETLTAKVTETSAVALTIEATIADEEAQLAIDNARFALDVINE